MLSIISAVSFGLVPLFTKVVLDLNFDVYAIGFFRFLGLGIFSYCMLRLKKQSLKMDSRCLFSIGIDSFFQVITLLLLSTSYLYIPTGNATSLHFMYPIFVFLILFLYYKNRFSRTQWIALVISIVGILFFIDFKDLNNGYGMTESLCRCVLCLFDGSRRPILYLPVEGKFQCDMELAGSRFTVPAGGIVNFRSFASAGVNTSDWFSDSLLILSVRTFDLFVLRMAYFKGYDAVFEYYRMPFDLYRDLPDHETKKEKSVWIEEKFMNNQKILTDFR